MTCVCYDATRLATRLFNLTPNGIDRIDFEFAKHFLAAGRGPRYGVLPTPFGPRLFAAEAARHAVDAIGAHWGEDRDPAQDPAYRAAVARLAEPASGVGSTDETPRIKEGRPGQVAAAFRWVSHNGLPVGRSLPKNLPRQAAYLNVSQFPIWSSTYLGWLENRRDVKAVFFIHDLLPIERPEFFRGGERQRHRRRLANVARFGAAAIVASAHVRAGLADYMRGLGRADLPILAAPIPSAATFSAPCSPDPALAATSYFVCCGTIEPRKNHMLLLRIWRALVAGDGLAAPKLLLIGARGWKYSAYTDLLARSPALRGHVIEVAGLTSPALHRLLAGARALLMPSFAEGYGLPVREALTTGIPVVASDIAAFREIDDKRLTLLDPSDDDAWLSTIRALVSPGESAAKADDVTMKRQEYFEKIEAFIASL